MISQNSVWWIKMVTKSEQELKDCCSAMVELFVMMVLVMTLLTLFAVKWDSLNPEVGGMQTYGVHSKKVSK